MPISSAQRAAIDDLLSRLAAESILAQVGRDDGLVPAYSLLGDLRTLCAGEPALASAVAAVHVQLERLLDAAQPFDAAALAALQHLIETLPNGTPAAPPPRGERTGSAAPIAALPSDENGDELMELNLEDNQELLAEFYAETLDHLQQIEAALLALDHAPDDPEAVRAIFRSFHTIKGNAGFLGLVPMHTLAHEVESLLDLARNQRLVLDAAIITEILRSRDALQVLLQQVGVALEKQELPSKVVPVRHLIAAVRRLATAAVPTEGTLAAKAAPVAPNAEGNGAPQIGGAGPAAAARPALAPVVPISVEAAAAMHAAAAKSAGGKLAGNATVRVSTEKLDSLMDVVGELVIVESQLIESARLNTSNNPNLQRNVAQLARITKELQSTAMSLRMIPIKPTFQKMERLARDLAREFGKQVAFVTSGEDTELDRTVVEEIGDPLVHMVRNALDHGLESAAERQASGKTQTGTLQLKAYHEGSSIVIELQDDGRGMDPDRLYGKAVERGLVAAGAPLSREDILALVFMPGFSTAEKITAVSGRGVGMDVVKRNIERLRGKIEIVSEVGRGTTFKVRLPLTMAIIDGLVVRVGTDRFIVPSTWVQMALRPQREHITTVHGRGEALDLRGRFVPIHRLHRRFGITAEAANPWDGILVILENSGKISALLVDEMITKQEVVIKNLGSFMQNLPGVAGGAILGDGNVALILDPGSLLSAA